MGTALITALSLAFATALPAQNPLIAIAHRPGDTTADSVARMSDWMRAVGRPIEHLVLDESIGASECDAAERVDELAPWCSVTLCGVPVDEDYLMTAGDECGLEPWVFTSALLSARARHTEAATYLGEFELQAGLGELRFSSLVSALPLLDPIWQRPEELPHIAPRLYQFLSSMVHLDITADGARMNWRHDAPFPALTRHFESLGAAFELTALFSGAAFFMGTMDRELRLDRSGYGEASTVLVDVRIETFGLVTAIKGLPVRWVARHEADTFRASATLGAGARVEVDGRAFGLLPGSVIDWLLPSDRKSMVKRVLDVLVHGDGGRGTWIDVAIERGDASVLTIRGGAELLDDELLRWVGQLLRDSVWPPDEAWDELGALLGAGYRAAVDDYMASVEALRDGG